MRWGWRSLAVFGVSLVVAGGLLAGAYAAEVSGHESVPTGLIVAGWLAVFVAVVSAPVAALLFFLKVVFWFAGTPD
jgi:hypothetical protein